MVVPVEAVPGVDVGWIVKGDCVVSESSRDSNRKTSGKVITNIIPIVAIKQYEKFLHLISRREFPFSPRMGCSSSEYSFLS